MKLKKIVHHVSARYSFRLAFLTNFIREPILRRLEREHGLIRPEWTVLVCLSYRDGASARDICEVSDQPRNTISRGVIALERRGLLSREPDPADARRTCLWLTDRGREMHAMLVAAYEPVEQRMLAQLEPHERAMFDEVLSKLCDSLDDWAGVDSELGLDGQSMDGAMAPDGFPLDGAASDRPA